LVDVQGLGIAQTQSVLARRERHANRRVANASAVDEYFSTQCSPSIESSLSLALLEPDVLEHAHGPPFVVDGRPRSSCSAHQSCSSAELFLPPHMAGFWLAGACRLLRG
jgi:hypothetical protein